MPNWCNTHYTLRGPKSDLEAIEKELNEMDNNDPRTPNGFGRLWLGELVDRLGGNSNAYIIDAYPVVLHWTDVLWSAISVFVIGLLATIYPLRACNR